MSLNSYNNFLGKAGMDGKNSGDWSLFDDEDEHVGLDEEDLFFLNEDEGDDDLDELESFEDVEAFEGHVREKRKKRDSGVRRHRKSTPMDKWSGEED